MKKKSLVLSLVVIGALLLAACGGAANNANGNGTPDAGAGNTGGTMPTSEFGDGLGTTPGAEDTGGGLVDGTPTVETGGEAGGADTTPTTDAGAGGAVDSTPTVDANAGGSGSTDTTPTAEAGTGTGSTPQAGIGGEMSNFVLLSDLLQVSVNSADGQQVGSVYGVVINRPVAETSSTTGSGTGSADAQATPTSDIGKGTGAGSTGSTGMASSDAPSIDYVLVSVDAGLGAGSDTSGSGTGTGSTDATATPATGGSDSTGSAGAGMTGNAVAVPWEAFRTQTGEAAAGSSDMGSQFNALVIDMDSAALAGAPRFTEESTVAQGWDMDAQTYWTNQGLSIPVTGLDEAQGEPVVIRDTLSTMNVMREDGQSFGQVTDFVVDLTTGSLAYAVISGSDASAGSFYAVPASHFQWSGDAAMGGTGSFSANFPQTAFDSAPSFTSLDELDLSGDWNTEVDTYWQSAGGNQ